MSARLPIDAQDEVRLAPRTIVSFVTDSSLQLDCCHRSATIPSACDSLRVTALGSFRDRREETDATEPSRRARRRHPPTRRLDGERAPARASPASRRRSPMRAGPVISAALTPVRSLASGANRIIGERPGARVRRVREMGHERPGQPVGCCIRRRAAHRSASSACNPCRSTRSRARPSRDRRSAAATSCRSRMRRSDDWRARWQRILAAHRAARGAAADRADQVRRRLLGRRRPQPRRRRAVQRPGRARRRRRGAAPAGHASDRDEPTPLDRVACSRAASTCARRAAAD